MKTLKEKKIYDDPVNESSDVHAESRWLVYGVEENSKVFMVDSNEDYICPCCFHSPGLSLILFSY